MADGVPYDSDAGRGTAAAITALMTGRAYLGSAEIAAAIGPYERYAENRERHNGVMRMHRDASYAIPDETCEDTELLDAARRSWDEAVELGERHGYRNAQATVLAPDGLPRRRDVSCPTSRGLVRIGMLGDEDGTEWQDLDVEVATDEGPRRGDEVLRQRLRAGGLGRDEARIPHPGHTAHRIKVIDADGDWVWRADGRRQGW